MTAIMGIKKKINGVHETIIAAESMITEGNTRSHLVNNEKVTIFPNFVVGFSGVCTTQTVVLEMLEDKKFLKNKFMKMETIADAAKFSREVFKEVHERLSHLNDDSFQSVGQLLIANSEKMFIADRWSFVSEYDDYCFIGCGEDFVAGVVHAGYKKVNSKKKLIKLANKALEHVSVRSVACGGRIYIYDLS